MLMLLLLAGCVFQSGSSSSFWNQGSVSRTVHAGSSSQAHESTVFTRPGGTVVIAYDARVDGGSLTLEVRPWTPIGLPEPYERLAVRESGSGELRATVDGRLSEVRVWTFGYRGSYDVTWRVE